MQFFRVGNMSRSHDLLGDFLMIIKTSLVFAGVKHCSVFSEVNDKTRSNASYYMRAGIAGSIEWRMSCRRILSRYRRRCFATTISRDIHGD